MTTQDTASPELAAATAVLLAAAFGAPVRLDGGAALSGRDHVFRFLLREGPPGAPASVIVKRPRLHEGATFDPNAADGAAPLLFNDWAALQFLTDAAGDAPVAPRYLAGDRASGLLVIEDLGAGESIDTFLLGADANAAESALLELARSLGRMHARTIGRDDEYNRVRDALGPRVPDYRERDLRALGPELISALDAMGVAAPPGIAADLEALFAALENPGPFGAYTHGDPCPDNCLRVDGRIRLIDFEVGAFRHALTDGVYGRIHFPTCWCVNRLPAELPAQMEQAYRTELVQGCPQAADDALFRGAVVEACAFWALVTCRSWNGFADLLKSDGEWGISTRRQRVLLRLPIAAQLAADAGHLEALGAAFAALSEKLRPLWAPEVAAMPLYPAFRAS